MAEERGINVAKAVAAAIAALAVSSCTLFDATWLDRLDALAPLLPPFHPVLHESMSFPGDEL